MKFVNSFIDKVEQLEDVERNVLQNFDLKKSLLTRGRFVQLFDLFDKFEQDKFHRI